VTIRSATQWQLSADRMCWQMKQTFIYTWLELSELAFIVRR